MSRRSAEALLALARDAARRGHAPYSGFHVGCAVESVDGEVALGANMENACYRLGVCAEQAALAAAQIAFGLDRVARVAVAGGWIGADGAMIEDAALTPCGGCRQAILEAAAQGGRDVEVVMLHGVAPIGQMLPAAFRLEAPGAERS